MRIIILLLATILIVPAFAKNSQGKENIKTIYEGQVFDSAVVKHGGTVTIELYKEFSRTSPAIATYTQELVKGKFKFKIDVPGIYYYVRIIYMDNGSEEINHLYASTNIYPSFFLAERNDSIRINIKDGKAVFSGSGAEKYQCQSEMFEWVFSTEGVSKKITKLANQRQYNQAYLLLSKRYDSVTKEKLAIIRRYSNKLKDDIKEILYYDCIALANLQLIYGLRLDYLNASDSDRKLAAKNFYVKYFSDKKLLYTRNSIISYRYSDFLFEKEKFDIEIQYDRKEPNYNIRAKEILQNISKKYKGALKDKLLVSCFLYMGDYYSFNDDDVQKTLKRMQNNYYKEILTTWKNSRTVGMILPDFEFSDLQGNTVSLAGFAGKMVVIDFWFLGCTGCVKLAKAMEPIIEKFKDDPNVVFLSVSIDNERSNWAKGLKLGIYTSSHQIHLYTNGLAEQHPIYKFFNFSGAPRMLIIDKDRKLVSVDPKWPSDEKEFNEFLNLLSPPNVSK